MSNGKCHSVNIIYYLKCKICYLYWESKSRQHKRFKVRIYQHISCYKTGDSTCKFVRHVYNFSIKNNCLEEPFFSLNIMLRLNKTDRLETIEKHFHLKGYNTMKNAGIN